MREYYYLTELENSPYKLSLSDALHLGSISSLSIYAFITDKITLQCRETREQVSDHDIYLQLPSALVGAIEKEFVKAQSQLNGNMNPGLALNQRHDLTQAIITDRYTGSIPLGTPFKQEPKGNFFAYISYPEGTPVQFPSMNYTVRLSDLLCWSDDPERLAVHGHIQRRDNGEAPTVTADEDSKECPPAITTLDDETELKRLQRTVAALALGLAAKPGTYNKAGKPNVSQLAKLATEHLRDGQSDRTPHGFSETTVRNTITAALKACPELKG